MMLCSIFLSTAMCALVLLVRMRVFCLSPQHIERVMCSCPQGHWLLNPQTLVPIEYGIYYGPEERHGLAITQQLPSNYLECK